MTTAAEREFNAIFRRPELYTARQRLDAALQFDATGRPGAVAIRERQERIRERLQAADKARDARQPEQAAEHELLSTFHLIPSIPTGAHNPPRTWADWLVYADWMEERGLSGAADIREWFALAVQEYIRRATPARPRPTPAAQLSLAQQWDRRAHATGDAARAVELARDYHRTERSLYTSTRADVVYGRGGQHGSDPTAYSKAYRRRYGHGAEWLNAGSRVEYPNGQPIVVIENFRGTEVARLPLPAAELATV